MKAITSLVLEINNFRFDDILDINNWSRLFYEKIRCINKYEKSILIGKKISWNRLWIKNIVWINTKIML